MTVIPVIQHRAVVDMKAGELGGDRLGQVLEPLSLSSQGFMCRFQALRHHLLQECAQTKGATAAVVPARPILYVMIINTFL